MSAINGLTIALLVIIVLVIFHYKNKIIELKRDFRAWQQGYTEINTKRRKAEKMLFEKEKKDGK